MTLNAVVFPAPFGPIRPTIWPSRTSNETPSRATMPPNRRVMFRSESSAIDRRTLFGSDPKWQKEHASGPNGGYSHSARERDRSRDPDDEGSEDHQPPRSRDPVRRLPRFGVLPLGQLRHLARPDHLRGRICTDDARHLDRLPPALHTPVVRDVQKHPLRPRGTRLDGGAGTGDPLGLRPPQAPQLRRPRGRSALSARGL